jgi:hypothetical protein
MLTITRRSTTRTGSTGRKKTNLRTGRTRTIARTQADVISRTGIRAFNRLRSMHRTITGASKRIITHARNGFRPIERIRSKPCINTACINGIVASIAFAHGKHAHVSFNATPATLASILVQDVMRRNIHYCLDITRSHAIVTFVESDVPTKCNLCDTSSDTSA